MSGFLLDHGCKRGDDESNPFHEVKLFNGSQVQQDVNGETGSNHLIEVD